MATFDSTQRTEGGAVQRAARFLRGWSAAMLLAALPAALAATEGKPAPPIRVQLADGSSFNLADNAGKVVVVNMWATWCAACLQEMPALDAYYRQHRDQGLVVIALSMDDPKDSAKVREATKRYLFAVGLAHDADMDGYGRIWRLPTTFVVDRHGVLRADQWYREHGLDAEALERTVDPLLRAP